MSGRYAEAIPIVRRMQDLDPANIDNYRILAVLYEATSQPFSAISVLDTAEVRFGRIEPLSDIKRRLLIATRQYDRAVEEVSLSIENAPYDSRNYTMLGEMYAFMGKDSLSGVYLRRAVEVDPSSVEGWQSLGDYHLQRREYTQYFGTLQHLFALDALPLERKTEIFERLTSDIRLYREFYPQINSLASTLALKYPDEQAVLDLYAGHLAASGDIERALSLYKIRLAKDDASVGNYMTVVDIEAYLERPDSVGKYLSQAIAAHPQSVELYIRHGAQQTAARDYAAAEKSFRKALRYARTDSLRSQVWLCMGDMHQQREDFGKMRSAYERSLHYMSDNALTLNNYAYALAVEGRDLERALEMSGRAMELAGTNATYLDTYAWILHRMGRNAEAKRTMQQALSLDRSNSTELYMHYGDILAELGEDFMAETYWRKARDNGYDAETVERRIEGLKLKKH